MNKLTTELLEKFVSDIKTDGMCEITDSQVESALIQLLAYEQAAKNPVAWVAGDEEIADFKNGREVCVMRDCDDEQLDYLPLYASPVLPKQPELMSIGELLQRLEEQTGEKWVEESAQPVMAEQWRSFVTDADITALHRFAECCDDPESGGHDLEKEQVQRLEKIGALQRSGRISYITDFGDYLISATAPINAQPVIPEQTERERIRREHAEWSDATFGNVGPVGPLKHLSKEALEAAASPDDLLEWADMQFLLWDAQRRMGIPDDFITIAMIEKLEINKKRQWPEQKDGEPRLHINTQSAQPVSNPYKFLGERAKYRVIIEGFSNSRSVDFEACSQEEAEEIGRDIFHEECNYGVERLESIPAQESE